MSNTEKGRDFVLGVTTDGGSTFDPIAGIRTKEFTRENPVADITNQGDTGNETASQYTGYSTVTLSGNGVMDTRVTGLFAYKDLAIAANSADPRLQFQLIDSTGEEYEGFFNITSFNKTGEQNGIVEFSIALQNEGVINFTAGT